MSVYDHHSLMTLKLDRWRDEPTLRGFEIRYLGFHRSARAAS